MTVAYDEQYNILQNKVEAAINASYNDAKEKFVDALKHGMIVGAVIYSAYDTDEKTDLPIDNLDQIPFKGTFTVVGDYDKFWEFGTNTGCEYESEPITDPTMLQLAVLANECIHTTNDHHHVYFESVAKTGNDTLRLSFGS